MKLTVIISGLGVGGAELMLARLLPRLQSAELACRVISLTGGGAVADDLRAVGIPVSCLDMRARPWRAVLGLYRLLRAERPDVVFTWLYHADLIGGLVARLAGCRRLIWNIRNTVIPRGAAPWSIHLLARVCAALSHLLPDRIVSCSRTAAAAHVGIGYAAKHLLVIPNGFDLESLRPDGEARATLHRELQVAAEVPLVGRVGRDDRQKDYPTFFSAAALMVETVPSLHFVVLGRGMDRQNGEVQRLIAHHGLQGRVHLLGERQDAYRVMAGLDLLVSSSLAEAFPNVVAEAMALGVPVVATAVGDSADILGEHGALVPPGNAAALGEQAIRLLSMDAARRAELLAAAREHIRQHFSLAAVAERYRQVLREVSADRREQR